MALKNYTLVPDAATAAGAPISKFQARAFAHNDKKFEEMLRGMTHQFWGALWNGPLDGGTVRHDGITSRNPMKIWRVQRFIVDVQWDLQPGIPLVVMASEKIEVNALINAQGKGLEASHGQLGGAGGGAKTGGPGAAPGFNVLWPGTDALLLEGGTLDNAPTPSPVSPQFLSFPPFSDFILRYLSHAAVLAGGAAGGGTNGGKGGGVVILIAPEIELGHSPTAINARGADGGVDCGGGGGGCVILATNTFPGAHPMSGVPVLGERVDITGGAGNNGAGAGGEGRRILIPLP